jgi:hypothetical protein
MKTTLVPSSSAINNNDGSVYYQLSLVVTDVFPGDLPSQNIFVYQIKAANNPKLDVFLRVGGIQDVTTLPVGRDVALLQGGLVYLSSNAAVSYTDVATANAAKELLVARVNTLISDWRVYNTSFSDTTPITLPTVSPDIINALKASYASQKDATAAAGLLLVQANATLTAAKKTSADASTTLAAAIAELSYCTTTKTILTQGIQDETVFVTAMRTFLTSVLSYVAANPTDPNIAVLTANANTAQAALNLEATAMNELNQALSKVTSGCVSSSTAVDTATLAKSQADQALGTATSAQAQATQALNAAQALQAATLQSLLAVCPDFVA